MAEWFRPLDFPGCNSLSYCYMDFFSAALSGTHPPKKKYCKSIFHEFFETLGVVHKGLSFILFLFQVRRCGNTSLPTIFSYLALLVIYNVFCETNVLRLC